MSTIGSAAPAGLSLISSIVGSSRPEASENQAKAASADQKALADRQSALLGTLGDVTDAEMGTERDADGRTAYRRSGQASDIATDGAGDENSPMAPANPRPADAFGERGHTLDIEA